MNICCCFPGICTTSGVRGVLCGRTCSWCGSTVLSPAVALTQVSPPPLLSNKIQTKCYVLTRSNLLVPDPPTEPEPGKPPPLLHSLNHPHGILFHCFTSVSPPQLQSPHVASAPGESRRRSWEEQLPPWNPTRGLLPYIGAANPRRRFSAAGGV